MVSNYLKTSQRNLRKRWPFSLTNMFAVAVGVSSFLFLIGYSHYEESFDGFHEHKDKLYRVIFKRYSKDKLQTISAYTIPGLGARVKEDLEEVVGVTRFFQAINIAVVESDSRKIEVPNLFYVDPDFISMFSFEVIKGNTQTPLENVNGVVITEAIASKFFGATDPIGKEMKIANEFGVKSCIVNAVVKDPPKNTSFQFGILNSIWSITGKDKNLYHNNWTRWKYQTFIQVSKGHTILDVKSKFPSFIAKYKTAKVENDIDWEFDFQEIEDIHLKSGFLSQSEVNPRNRTIQFLKIIACLIIIVSWINYINVSTASLQERAKEVGVRKSIGAKKRQIFQQYLVEVVLVNTIACIAGLAFIYAITPYLGSVFQLSYSREIYDYPAFWGYFGLILILGVFFSGLYPAIVLSNLNPVKVLKSKNTTTTTSPILRKILVGVQYFVSIFLIAGTFIIILQNKFLKEKELGMDLESVVIVKKPQLIKQWKYVKNIPAFKEELKKLPEIIQVSVISSIPSMESWTLAIWDSHKAKAGDHRTITYGVDEDFINIFDLEVIAGRNFEKGRKADELGLLLSEKAVTQLEFQSPEEALGKTFSIEGFKDDVFTVIGVVKNYHHSSPKVDFYPMSFVKNRRVFWAPRFTSIKISNLEAISAIKRVYQKFFPQDLFNYEILTETYNKQFEEEDRSQNIFIIFSFLTIVLASIGVIGMSSYIAFTKRKEIAVRKVFGATKNDVFNIISKEFLLVFVSASLLAIPLIYYVMNNWLQNFAHRIDISIIYILPAILGVFCITLIIVLLNTRKSLRSNPVKALSSL